LNWGVNYQHDVFNDKLSEWKMIDSAGYSLPQASPNQVELLETIKEISPKTKLYQASSSEMFGDVLEKFQNEKTPFNPRSPYAVAKVFGHYITKNYREAYNLYTVSGILFNHESPLRGEEFITRKITSGLIKIINNRIKCLEVGNLYAKRDWGHAKEYVCAMWKMLQQKKPDDYVISTGKTYSVKDFINECIKYLKIKTKWVGKGMNEKLINLSNKINLLFVSSTTPPSISIVKTLLDGST
jgi:GDPmannose 4,6-dehydratase